MGTIKLLEPIKIGNKTFRNRILMAPMEARLNTPDGSVSDAMIDYYVERAKGGVAAVIVENTFIDNKSSRSGIISSGLHNDHMIAGKNLLAEGIKEFGAIAILQISHGGPQANPAANNYPIVGPSALDGVNFGKEFHELTISEIEEIEDSFAQTARRACQAGFDGVEIHGAHGYLISSFLSPHMNLRTDAYGGSTEKRSTILRNIIGKIHKVVTKDFIVGVRINAIDGVEGGVTLEDSCETVRRLGKQADYISVSAGVGAVVGKLMIPPLYIKGPTIIDLVAEVKNNASVPVFGVGALDYKTGEEALEKGYADAVLYGRALIADPELPKKLMEGRPEDIRPCCRGNEGCFSRLIKAVPIRCEVNPACGQEAKRKIKKAEVPKKIAIVGGGIAGLESARVASLMGHKVVLFEKSGKLGGHLLEGGEPYFKHKTHELLIWLIDQVEKSNVEVRLNTIATEELISEFSPDEIIVAVGSKYILPPIPGTEFGVFPDKVLLKEYKTDKRIVIVGAGMVGAETALSISADKSKEITLIEMRESIAPEHDPVSQGILFENLVQNGVKVLTRCMVKEISKDKVFYCNADGETKEAAADTTVIATGLHADEEQVAAFKSLANVHFIGDCVKASKIFNSMHDAWNTILKL